MVILMYDGPHEAAHRQLESAKPVLNSELLQQPLILCPTEQEVEQVGTVCLFDTYLIRLYVV